MNRKTKKLDPLDILDEDQLKAVEKLHSGAILVGDVGSGKSRTALYYYWKNWSNLPLYIFTTAKKRDSKDWEDEAKLFGGKRLIKKVDSWNNIQKYTDLKDCFVIFDEQHASGTGKWAKAFVKIARGNKWITLSATPADNYFQLWAHFVANGYFRNKSEFVRNHVVYSSWSKFPKVERYLGVNLLEKYRRQMYVVMRDRRLTSKHDEDVWCTYDMVTYKLAFKRRWNVFEDKPIENVSELGQVIRRIVNEDASRIVELYRILADHPKAIVFYNFNYERDILRAFCKQFHIVYGELNGENHDDIPSGDTWLYLVQYFNSEAWNCIECDTVIFYSQTYSYKTLKQAKGRIDRRNTPFEDLYYFHLKSRSPIDLAISKALKNKKDFNEKRYFEGG